MASGSNRIPKEENLKKQQVDRTPKTDLLENTRYLVDNGKQVATANTEAKKDRRALQEGWMIYPVDPQQQPRQFSKRCAKTEKTDD